jgi:hypothetical protein
MGADGAFPGEARSSLFKRLDKFKRDAAASGSYAPSYLEWIRLWLRQKI